MTLFEYLAIAFERQGHNLLKIARYQESLPAFEQALSNIPHNLSAQKGKGISLYELGDYSQAIAIFNQILQRNNLTAEQEAISWLYIGVSHCQEKRSEAARSAFTQVLKLTKDPRSIEIARKGCGIY